MKKSLRCIKSPPEWEGFLCGAAIVLATLGFSGWAGTASGIVQILAVIFGVLLLFSCYLSRPHSS
ncbi:MAG: DUF1328 domain-containing protein [Verrucomicrobium sp.]|nr:DUF1328 domain-containing protein [Verrucomicrobium sp.]